MRRKVDKITQENASLQEELEIIKLDNKAKEVKCLWKGLDKLDNFRK